MRDDFEEEGELTGPLGPDGAPADVMASWDQASPDQVPAGPAGLAEVVRQRDGFGEVFVQPQRAGDITRDPRNLYGVRQPRAEVIGDTLRENLSLILKPAEGAGVNDAVTITLERSAIRMLGFGVAPSARVLNPDGIFGEHG